ncbi:uncharacterized protein LOC115756923 [Rhodamnia argentea]|uniref:Uncharacterized protein LOC115756923 n=1 Tax=Rhodamnia argentea TaxID=178133 RepID=A0A8B8R070_9MYRT|nr:uncharacterized protein LOC115756923 [Rhodamnia argentea]
MVKGDFKMILGFPSLKKVVFSGCSELRYLFPYFTATTLRKLEILEIMYCEHKKEVVPKEEGGRSKADVMSFPSSTRVSIIWCSDFRTFSPSPTNVERKLGKTAQENDESPQPVFNEMVTLPNVRSLQIMGAQCKELWNNQITVIPFANWNFFE